MLPAILAQIGLPALMTLISKGFEKSHNPVAKEVSSTLSTIVDKITSPQLTDMDLKEVNRHIEALSQQELEKESIQLMEINESLRTEAKSEDWYVRRMRPTFGYIMAFTWGIQMLALAYTIIAEPDRAGGIVSSMESLSMIWSVGLSVLGIYVYKRSEDKKQKPR